MHHHIALNEGKQITMVDRTQPGQHAIRDSRRRIQGIPSGHCPFLQIHAMTRPWLYGSVDKRRLISRG